MKYLNEMFILQIIDDGKLPRTICPSCHIQLQGTVSFFNLLSDGQKKLYNLLNTQELLRDEPDNSPKQGGSSILKSIIKGTLLSPLFLLVTDKTERIC